MALNQHEWPSEAALILSAIEIALSPESDRRMTGRVRCRVAATLEVFGEVPKKQSLTIYTRDANSRSLGFITRQALPAAAAQIYAG